MKKKRKNTIKALSLLFGLLFFFGGFIILPTIEGIKNIFLSTSVSIGLILIGYYFIR